MINERDRHISRPIVAGQRLFAARGLLTISERVPIMNALPSLQIAIGLTALIAVLALRRSEKGRGNRGSSGDGSSSGDSGYDGGDSDITTAVAAIMRARAIPAAATEVAVMEVVAGTAVVEATSGATANNGNRSYASAAAVLDSF
jgi:hypothetical protein